MKMRASLAQTLTLSPPVLPRRPSKVAWFGSTILPPVVAQILCVGPWYFVSYGVLDPSRRPGCISDP
jgi:hypothetical protein